MVEYRRPRRRAVKPAVLPAAAALAVAATLAAGMTGPQGSGAAQLSVRFHHLHYRAADPGHALGEAAEMFGGNRTILQGVGVGVRVGREYVLFERARADDVRVSGPRRPAEAYAAAVAFLRSRGIPAAPLRLADTSVAAPIPDAILDHVAFAADDLSRAATALSVKPFPATRDSVRVATSTGGVVEIVRDTDRPETWWCPMHPDVRSAGAGTCPLCAMALVPIPPPRMGEFALDVELQARPGGGASGLTVTVRDPQSTDGVQAFVDIHERPLHLFIVSRDLSRFEHVHPEPVGGGRFTLRHDLPAGEYVVVADFLPAGATSQFIQRAVVTPGYHGHLFAPLPDLELSPQEQTAGDLRIRIELPAPVARRETPVRFHIADARTGLPVADLQPYLGAAGHALFVNQDLSAAMHGHPAGEPTSGPAVTFSPVFPAPGRYKVWVQFQRGGRVQTAAFVIEIPQP
jgi:hypothetical protein